MDSHSLVVLPGDDREPRRLVIVEREVLATAVEFIRVVHALGAEVVYDVPVGPCSDPGVVLRCEPSMIERTAQKCGTSPWDITGLLPWRFSKNDWTSRIWLRYIPCGVGSTGHYSGWIL